jgi:hypothetical protein
VTRARSQQGMTMVIALIMLVVITLFVVSMVRMSNTNAMIVGNMQAQKAVEAEAQQAIEIAMNNFDFFDDAIGEKDQWASSSTQYLSYAALWTNYKPGAAGSTAPATQASPIRIYRPQCMYFEPASGYSALSGVAPQDTYWDLKVTAADSFTGSSTEIHQGVQMRLPAGNCK